MGYACPVCGDPQADAGHLANHLAFTAILREDAHEAWLDEHAPEWGRMDEATLADHVVDRVEETEFPQVFEDTVGGLDPPTDALAERSGALFEDHDHDHDGDRAATGSRVAREGGRSTGPVDEETAAILEEAREMTRRMYADVENEGGDAGRTDDGGRTDDSGRIDDDGRPDATDRAVDGDNGTDDASADGAENE